MHGKIGREPGGGGEPAPVPGKSAGIAAAIVTASVVGIGLSLSIPLLSIRLEIEGHSASAIGVQTAFGALATLFGAPLVPTLAAKMGVRRLLLAAVALGATTLIAFAVLPGYWPWLALRIVYGGALTVIFVMSEYWINALAPADRRGMVLGIYATALSLGFAAGPALLGFTGATGSSPFVAGAALFALAAIPLGLAGASAPPLGREPHGGVMRFLGAAPAATFAALLVGAIEAGAMGLLPVFALRTGLGADFGAMLVTLFALGNVLVQIPIGMISDRMDRRRLLLIIALAGLVGAIALPVAAAMGPGTLGTTVLLWGGSVGAMYAVGLAHLGARFSGATLASANAAFIMLYSLGMLIGPIYLGIGLDLWPGAGLFLAMASIFAGYALIVLARLMARGGTG